MKMTVKNKRKNKKKVIVCIMPYHFVIERSFNSLRAGFTFEEEYIQFLVSVNDSVHNIVVQMKSARNLIKHLKE